MKGMKNIRMKSMACLLSIAGAVAGQVNYTSTVLDESGKPIEGAVITVLGGSKSTVSAVDGSFQLDVPERSVAIQVDGKGFYPSVYRLSAKHRPNKLVLTPDETYRHTELFTMPQGTEYLQAKSTSAEAMDKAFLNTALSIDEALKGNVTGLNVVGKSGMPGEGAYLNVRGLHSLMGENNPLLVINGVPYFSNDNTSLVINGYSRSLLSAYNPSDIKQVTLVKGGAAALYGSLGSNGVLMIETEQAQSDDMETRISYSGQFGTVLPKSGAPLLNASEYAEYMRNIGMTRYSQMSALYADYPFLQGSNDYYEQYIFNNNTDWQAQVFSPATTSNNVLRVEGGDEIAKYNMSVGYTSEGGVLGETQSDRYSTLINSNILVSRNVDIFTTVGLSYSKSILAEQGMTRETNPLLAAQSSMPQLNPFKSDDKGRLSSTLAPYDFSNVNANPSFAYENVSNPLALVRSVQADDKRYDANINLGLNYQWNEFLRLTGNYHLSYRYTEENLFVPGLTSKTILPQYYGIGQNTVRKGITEYKNQYFSYKAQYHRLFDGVHQLDAHVGGQFMTYQLEYDRASGFNTANDFYKTLGYTTDEADIAGFNEHWVWLNHSLHAAYTYDQWVKTYLNASFDASSVSGVDAPRLYVYPAVGVNFMMAQTDVLPELFNRFNLRLEFAQTGNSRFSSNYARNYYQNANFFTLGTITRSNVPNTYLEPEKSRQWNAGLDASVLNGRIHLGLDAYRAIAYDLLIARNISAVYGSDAYYDNKAELSNRGLELSLHMTPIQTKEFEWILGGNISMVGSRVEALGDCTEMLLTYRGYNDDDVQVVLREGEAPYQFLGYRTNGVYASNQEAQTDGLTTVYGGTYQAGDVRFVDVHPDGVINEKDKVLLGNGRPDYYGNVFSRFGYKNWSLQANFTYSVGNQAYNAVRRDLESMSNFYNQSAAVRNRWQLEGQQTHMPRAVYGDPSGNNVFSDRWVEDASFIKLSRLMVSYEMKQGVWNLFRSGRLWVSGENLLTWTQYLGADPEFAYSYDEAMLGFDYAKVSQPVSFRVGIDLNF